jgi:hypothetical protein
MVQSVKIADPGVLQTASIVSSLPPNIILCNELKFDMGLRFLCRQSARTQMQHGYTKLERWIVDEPRNAARAKG